MKVKSSKKSSTLKKKAKKTAKKTGKNTAKKKSIRRVKRSRKQDSRDLDIKLAHSAFLMPRKTCESAVEMRELVMPHHANPQNTIFGGVVMSWIDMAAAMVAARHSHLNVVTAHVDSITFEAPIRVGHHVTIRGSINYAGKTSMEIGVRVESENPITGVIQTTTTAFLTMVAVDDFGKPCPVPPVYIETEEDKRRYDNAKKRIQSRKKLKNNLKKKKK